ncbi:PLD nuclease N-terminal domain-containing protein [Flindersiella endophytica]
MTRALPAIITIALAIFCLIDLGMTRAGEEVRILPKWAWVFIILFFPILGPIAWLFAGRPKNDAPPRPLPHTSTPPLAPDDDPAFLADLERKQQASERERLQKWQAELERRERELGTDDTPSDGDSDGKSG